MFYLLFLFFIPFCIFLFVFVFLFLIPRFIFFFSYLTTCSNFLFVLIFLIQYFPKIIDNNNPVRLSFRRTVAQSFVDVDGFIS